MKINIPLHFLILQFTCFVQYTQAQDCRQWENVQSGTTWRYETYTPNGKLFKAYAAKVEEVFTDSTILCKITTYLIHKNDKWIVFGTQDITLEDDLYKIKSHNADGSIPFIMQYLCDPQPGDKQKDYKQADVYMNGILQYTFSVEDISFGEKEEVSCPAGTFTCVPMRYLRNDGGKPSVITEWINNDIGVIKSTAADIKGKIAFTTMLVGYVK